MRVISDFEETTSMTGGAKMTKEERTEYLKLVIDLALNKGTREELSAITNALLEKVKEKAHELISENVVDEHEKMMLNSEIEGFFTNIDRRDDNLIRMLNIFSMQCSMLFTQRDSLRTDNYCEQEPRRDKAILFNGDSLWKQYSVLLSRMRETYVFRELLQEESRDVYIITIIDYLSIEEIIYQYTNRIFLSGFTFTDIIADGNLYSPLGFIEHDIIHGANFNYACIGRTYLDIEKDVIRFINYIKTTEHDVNNVKKIMIILFLLIHETQCDFHVSALPPNPAENEIWNRLTKYTRILGRLNMLNNLGLLIPKSRRHDVESFLRECLSLYTEKALEYKATPFYKGGSQNRKASIRKQRRSTNKKKRNRRTHKKKAGKRRVH